MEKGLTDKEMKARASIYFASLRDLPCEALEAACRQIVKSDKWFPTIARIREVALDEIAQHRAMERVLTILSTTAPEPPPETEEMREKICKMLANLAERLDARTATDV
jgi:hypothetical protein